MKKNLTLIAFIATALISSCGSSEKTDDAAALQNAKPKVKIAQVYTEDVAQLEEYATTVEAEVKNNIIPNSPLRIAKILVEVGKVGQIYLEEDAIAFENGDIFSNEFIIGTADKTYNKIGTYLSIVESKWGFLFIVLVPCLLIFIYEIYALIVEIKYGEEEND